MACAGRASPRRAPRALALSLVLVATATPEAAWAQRWGEEGLVGIGTGLEGGDPGAGSLAWRRARTRIVLGFDMAADEAAYPAFGVRGFAEIEHAASVGLRLHYARWVAPWVGLFAGITGVVAPETLAGIGGGATFVIPLGRKVGLFAEPEFVALPVGSDVPSDSVVLWGLLSVGARVHL